MTRGVPAVTTCEIGVASGLLGAGVGYILAPRKFNLEQLLRQDSNEFNQSIRTKYLKPDNKEQNKAYQAIVKARENLTKAFETNKGEAKLVEYTRKPELIRAYKHIKRLIPHARGQSALFVGILSGIGAAIIRIFSNKHER